MDNDFSCFILILFIKVLFSLKRSRICNKLLSNLFLISQHHIVILFFQETAKYLLFFIYFCVFYSLIYNFLRSFYISQFVVHRRARHQRRKKLFAVWTFVIMVPITSKRLEKKVIFVFFKSSPAQQPLTSLVACRDYFPFLIFLQKRHGQFQLWKTNVCSCIDNIISEFCHGLIPGVSCLLDLPKLFRLLIIQARCLIKKMGSYYLDMRFYKMIFFFQ